VCDELIGLQCGIFNSINSALGKRGHLTGDERCGDRCWCGMGHVHLKVADLERRSDFTAGSWGFQLMQRFGDSAGLSRLGVTTTISG